MLELVHSIILIFADDTKISRRMDTLEDCEELHKDDQQADEIVRGFITEV